MSPWLALATADPAFAAAPGEILRDLEHLRVAGTVLYVAAHPDDENTSLLAWLEGDRGIRAVYLSMTRGGGGQNLVGAEQGQLLGVVRTGELMAARALDGAEQRFTRAVDFGYSTSAEETLSSWGHDEALDDVVRAIREVRPDVVVTRFPTEGQTHGHHLASARLAHEAFALAADPVYVTPGLGPWSADRLVHNVSSWSLEPGTDTSGWARVDVNTWDPLLGRSYGEVAAASRSMHKSQGFGSAPEIGPDLESFEGRLGTPVAPGGDPLAGLELTLGRFEGTERLDKALRVAADRFDPRAPEASLPRLAAAHERMADLPDPEWRARKTAELEDLMARCAGLVLTARAERPAVAPGQDAKVTLTAQVRAPVDLVLRQVSVAPSSVGEGRVATTVEQRLGAGVPWTAAIDVTVPADAAFTRPHWLVEPGTPTRDTITDPSLRNLADTPPPLRARFVVALAGRELTFVRPVAFAEVDPVAGERVEPVEILPPVTATFDGDARILPAGAEARTRVTLRADAGPATGTLRLAAPAGLTATPTEVPFALTPEAPERIVEVALAASAGASPGSLVATVEVEGVSSGLQRAIVDHPHLPRRTVLFPAAQRLVPVDLARGDTKLVGYVAGPGDAVPAALRAAGYAVEDLDEAALASGELSRFDAIVMGIRAYNTRPRLLDLREPLMAYVAEGGRLLVQYNTNNRFDPLSGGIGPYPFSIGRGRVTDESAGLTPVIADHPALVGPNPLGPADFEGWVQERGLYFAESWDPAYQPLFSAHDPGEEPLLGSTLVAHHGEGVFVYTGLSFFRQLPAGVPGAYRLLANLLALE